MPLKLIFENHEKIKLFNSDQSNLKNYIVKPLLVLLIFSPELYFFGIVHPSYQIHCTEKNTSVAAKCSLKSTYLFIIPWYTNLGDVTNARFQINPHYRQNRKSNSCGEIALLTSTVTNPLSYAANPKIIPFYLSCGNFAQLENIASEINDYLKQIDVTVLNIPSLPITFEQYFWTLGLIAAVLYSNKRIEVIIDKNINLVSVKTSWIIFWTQTYSLNEVKKILFYVTKDSRRHLVMKLVFNTIDLGDVSDLSISEQKQLHQLLNNFLGFNS